MRVPGPLRWLLFAVVLTALPVATGRPGARRGRARGGAVAETAALLLLDAAGGLRHDRGGAAPGAVLRPARRTRRSPRRSAARPAATDVVPQRPVGGAGARAGGRRARVRLPDRGRRRVGGELRAWVFAPPVTRSRATELVEDAAGREGCTRAATAPAYGSPSVALVCPAGDRRWASFRGLYGDAWLACSLAAPASLTEQQLLDRAGRWCVAVARRPVVTRARRSSSRPPRREESARRQGCPTTAEARSSTYAVQPCTTGIPSDGTPSASTTRRATVIRCVSTPSPPSRIEPLPKTRAT